MNVEASHATTHSPAAIPRAQSSAARTGTALTWLDLALLTVASTTLFAVYPTLLWRAAPGASHVARFFVSYVAVIPFAAALLYARTRRVPLREVTAAVLIVWAIKMLVTVGLYHAFVAGSHETLEPSAPPAHIVRQQDTGYHGTAGFVGRELRGTVAGAGAGTIVFLDGMTGGMAAPAHAAPLSLRIGAGGFEPRVLVATLGATLDVTSDLDATVVLHGEADAHTVFNAPVVPGSGGRRIVLAKPGLIRISPSVGPARGEAWVLVVEHPYYTRTDKQGRFAFSAAPTDEVTLAVLRTDPATGAPLRSETRVAAGTDTAEISVEQNDRGPASLDAAP